MPIDAEGAAVVPIPMFRKWFAIHAALAQNHYVDLRTQIPPMPIEDSPLLRWAKYRNHLNQSQLQYSITDPTVKPQSCGFKQETTTLRIHIVEDLARPLHGATVSGSMRFSLLENNCLCGYRERSRSS